MRCWFRRPIPWFQVRIRSEHALAAWTVSAALTQRGRDAFDQVGCSEGFGEEAHGSCVQCLSADAVLGECRDKDERQVMTLCAQKYEKVQTAHSRHLHIRNDTGRLAQAGRLQKFFCRGECVDQKSVRAEEIFSCGPDGCIVVNN
jgi:hypothetical protein